MAFTSTSDGEMSSLARDKWVECECMGENGMGQAMARLGEVMYAFWASFILDSETGVTVAIVLRDMHFLIA